MYSVGRWSLTGVHRRLCSQSHLATLQRSTKIRRKKKTLSGSESTKRFQDYLLNLGVRNGSGVKGESIQPWLSEILQSRAKVTTRSGPMTISTLISYVNCLIHSGDLTLVSKAINICEPSIGSIPTAVYVDFLRALAIQGKNPPEFKRIWTKYRKAQEDLDPSALLSLALLVGKFPEISISVGCEAPLSSFLEDLWKESLYLSKKDRDIFLEGLVHLGITQNKELSSPSNSERLRYKQSILSGLNSNRASCLASQLNPETQKSQIFNSSYIRQLETEKKGYLFIDSILKNTECNLEEVESAREILCAEWKNKIISSLRARINRLKSSELKARRMLSMSGYPFLNVLPVETLAEVAVEEAMKLITQSESYCPSVYVIQLDLGHRVFRRLEVASNLEPEFFESLEKTYSSYVDWYLNPSEGPWWCHREALIGITENETMRRVDRPVREWTGPIELFVGRELLKHIMDSVFVRLDHRGNIHIGSSGTKIKINAKNEVITSMSKETDDVSLTPLCPGLYRIYRQRKFSQVEEIKPHPILSRLFNYAKLSSLKFNTEELPMLVPPIPWISTSRGGYLLTNSDFIRASEIEDSTPLNEGDGQCQERLKPVMDSINQLGSTPWKVNSKLLDLAVELFHSKSDEYSQLITKLNIPRHPDHLSAPELDPSVQLKVYNNETLNEEELQTYKSFNINKQVFARIKNENYSLWCDCLYRLSLANHFRNDVLYFPHNLDFRGRVYPIPPHFNHMGGDLPRSLLVFAKGKPLGSMGFTWLKLQAINLTGLKKRCSIQERLDYANEKIDDILDSAERPFNGRKWWTDSEDPWQTLSVCFEIKAAIDSGDPENYVCHIPIHQDGSCNGLQHYAAIGRDVLGAGSVNLIPSDVPQDVYSEIAILVEKKRAHDASSREIARKLEGFINRKVIKQTVMTTVYGVTAYGARLQIARQLKDIKDFPSEFVDEGSKYLAQRTFDSLNELFTASQEIQLWLTEAANVISKIFSSNVEWETPLGLNVVQPYRKIVGNSFKAISIWSQPTSKKVKVNSAKQRNGFPPNYIHSLDSTHMMLTSLHLWNSGVTFASVHDCYWTHPDSVNIMNETCRTQFINLHSQPLLENLSKSFKERYAKESKNRVDAIKAELLFKNIPRKGSLDLGVVKDSVFFFS